MYEHTITLNADASTEVFNFWLRANHTFEAITYDDTDAPQIFFASEPSAAVKDEIDTFYTNMTASVSIDPLEAIKHKYIIREIDGKDFYNTLRAELVLEYEAGDLSASDVAYIEARLSYVLQKLQTGDWKTAQIEIAAIPPITQDDIDNGYSQARHDAIEDDIDEYVTNNY